MLDILVAIDMEIAIVLEVVESKQVAFLSSLKSKNRVKRNLREVLIVLIGCYDTVPKLKGTCIEDRRVSEGRREAYELTRIDGRLWKRLSGCLRNDLNQWKWKRLLTEVVSHLVTEGWFTSRTFLRRIGRQMMRWCFALAGRFYIGCARTSG